MGIHVGDYLDCINEVGRPVHYGRHHSIAHVAEWQDEPVTPDGAM